MYSRPWAAGQPLRPVVVVFHGGGFIRGSAAMAALPPSGFPVLNVSADNDVVFVYPNYRLNAFGFLPGREGGGRRAVGPQRRPAGPGRRAALDARPRPPLRRRPRRRQHLGPERRRRQRRGQVLADHGGAPADPPLFRRALASSPYWPRTYAFDAPEAQAQYDRLAELVGCAPAATGNASLACLKAADVQALRDAAATIAASHAYTTSSYTWAPVVDGRFLRRPLSELARADRAVDAALAVYNTHEGESFLPPAGLASAAAFDAWLAAFLPGLSADDLRAVRDLYPAAGSAEALATYSAPTARAGLVYRDLVLACPAYWMAGAAPDGAAWLAEYSISPAKHASDTYWVSDTLHWALCAGRATPKLVSVS